MTERDYDGPRDEKGRYTPKYETGDFLETLIDLGEPSTTEEIANEMNCPYDTAYYYLNLIEDKDLITSRKRANVRFWTITNQSDSQS